MGKSEYFEVRKVEGEVEQPQIILDAEANEGYKHNEILIRKYGFKFNKLKHKNNDKTGNRRAQERAGLAHT